jgi:tetratricopeptide (TPR) repeat protein/energy-coupling factor transporter ATP-binding protein EcfA2
MSAASATALSSARPFPGLKPFDYPDHEYFFGREDQSYALYRLIDRNHFVAVVGSSGSGKSSLVRAGLRALLEEEKKSGGPKWTWLEMRPGEAPLTRLARLLTTLWGDKDSGIAAGRQDRIAFDLRQSSFGIVSVLEQLGDRAKVPLVLVVDQFEELFRYIDPRPQERAAQTERLRDGATDFVQLLLEASRSRMFNIRVLVTMRSDFIGACSRFHGLPEAVSAAQFLVPGMTRDQIEQAIREPIEQAGGTIDPILVERLLNDSSEEDDRLPALQHCLLRLWDEARRPAPDDRQAPIAETDPSATAAISAPPRITEKHYEPVGGVANALSHHAEGIFAKLDDGEKLACEQMFRALAEIDRDGRIIRRARSYEQLFKECGVPGRRLRKVIGRLRADDCSFLTTSSPTITRETRIDVSHEALLRNWKRISGDREAIRTESARENADSKGWLKAERDDGERYRGLVSLIDENEKEPDASFASRADDRWAWWTSRPRTRSWAERYGGRVDEVRWRLQWGRTQKRRLVRRRRIEVAGGVAAVILLSVLVTGAYTKHLEGLQTQKAELALKHAGEILAQVPLTNNGSMRTETQKKLLSVATEIAGDAVSSANKSAVVAKLFIRLQITGSDISLRAGDERDALRRAELARDEARKSMALDPSDTEWQYWEIEGLHRAENARLRIDGSTVEDGLARLQSAEPVAERLADGTPLCDSNGLNHRQRLIYLRNQIADFLVKKRDFWGALEKSTKALADAERFKAEAPRCLIWPREAGHSKDRIGSIYLDLGKRELALQTQNEALALRLELARLSNDNSFLSNVALSHHNIGLVWEKFGEYEKARVEHERALSIRRELVDIDPGNAGAQEFLVNSYRRLGEVYKALSQQEKARENYRRFVATRQLLKVRDSSDVRLQRAWENSVSVLASYESAQGDAYEAKGNKDEAIKAYQQAVAALEPLLSNNKAAAELYERTREKIRTLTAAN